jgi:hypothetical protein
VAEAIEEWKSEERPIQVAINLSGDLEPAASMSAAQKMEQWSFRREVGTYATCLLVQDKRGLRLTYQ